ncbi:MAG: putative acyl esterase [Hyphomicrobiaceae bacterium]|jgi:predicted acyl esterase
MSVHVEAKILTMLEGFSELLGALRAIIPILGRSIATGQLLRPSCELVPASPDVHCDYDVRIPISDGTYVTANIFRSRRAMDSGQTVPTIMSAHPYDASLLPARGRTPAGGPPQQYRLIPQARRPRFSELTSWEAPDPNFWTDAGYAVVNMNMPGYATSTGQPSILGENQTRAFYEAIEWVAAQPWSNGRVGLSGVSYLAISQYYVATCKHLGGPPPALRAISPWEGVADFYREFLNEGGITECGFPNFWWITEVKPAINGTAADLLAHDGTLPPRLILDHPDYDDFWKARAPQLEDITLPMLVCGSFADHGLHTEGSFNAFVRAQSKQKWLYTHRDLKWDAFYSDEALATMRSFFDCFLKKDGDQSMLERASVRLEVRSARELIHKVREEHEWPLARTVYRPLYLDLSQGRLSNSEQATTSHVAWNAQRGSGTALTYVFEDATEWTGHMKLRLWVEVRALGNAVPNDMAIFAALRKLDRRGNIVPFHGAGGNKFDAICHGQIAASCRKLDPEGSTPWRPQLLHNKKQLLEPGVAVVVEIPLPPSSTWFEAGEGVELVVAPTQIIRSPPFRKDSSRNAGIHVLHGGSEFDSHLLVPEIPQG